mgnify:CR=1 FL=1
MVDGVHDMGGMDGFGPVAVEDDAAFHADWERLVFGLVRLLRMQDVYVVDESRYGIERMPPRTYLNATYYERWLASMERNLREKGVIEADDVEDRLAELAEGRGDTASVPEASADLTALVEEQFRADAAFEREPQEPQFRPGASVRVRNIHPDGHTRCPRYVRRCRGTINDVRGTFVVPDDVVRGEETAEPLYSVRFETGELWGPDAEADDAVSIDLWERYLEPVEGD